MLVLCLPLAVDARFLQISIDETPKDLYLLPGN